MIGLFGPRVLWAALAAAALVGPAPAAAATMTFDGIDDYVETWSEDDILAVGDGQVGSFEVDGTAHMDDGGSGYASRITFTMDLRFSALSFGILPTSSAYVRCDEDGCEELSFDNVEVNGYRDGALVAETAFDMYAVEGTYAFDAEFRNIDALRIGFSDPFIGQWPDGSDVFCDDSPCTHFNIDDVTLAPVPLPAAVGLLAAALGGLAWIGRRRRA